MRNRAPNPGRAGAFTPGFRPRGFGGGALSVEEGRALFEQERQARIQRREANIARVEQEERDAALEADADFRIRESVRLAELARRDERDGQFIADAIAQALSTIDRATERPGQFAGAVDIRSAESVEAERQTAIGEEQLRELIAIRAEIEAQELLKRAR